MPGTSAGGLVGGLYATGMSPAELRSLMTSTDWDLMFHGDSPYALKDFRRKEDARDYPTALEFGLRKGLTLPSGLNAGQQVELLLAGLTSRYYAIRSFDDLPVPFRCTATDLIKGSPVILGDGPLSVALRATVSLPGVFTPVRRGGQLLADGGLLNNVPADVVRAMGADIVIAVDVGEIVAVRPGEESLFAVMGRTLDVLMDYNAARALRSADIVISPKLTDFGSMDWRRSGEIAD
ncbi:MAG: patatin-like phospholipase family protein, partial [Acidobacteria bacterium]|nr:patatin-like phospholipase family protein [Acidobacteriota bacterium]